MRSTATTTTIVAAVLLRACVSLHGYSGEGVPPMYGDFEAQRHWMEVTVNLPAERWYVHGPDNDLQYWGLDYPPLSAHFSWAVGRLAQAWHPQLVALHASRGHESAETRAFMRRSVLVADLLVFVPAALAFARLPAAAGGGGGAPTRTLALLLLSPPLVLVDHGHFQYNCVSLGLALWALVAALSGRPLACCVAFSLSLNFKQMGLYLAPAVFCYLLAGVLRTRGVGLAASRFCALGAVTSLTFAACWAPFLASATPYDSTLAVLRRVFPTSRSLYEDKVANVWCTMALLPPLKLKAKLALEALLRLSLGCTLAALLPPCALLLRAPSRRAFLLCATACGLAFFLLSFQVHEKHLLLPLLPAALLSTEHPRAYAWFALLAAFSMFPLLARDGLRLAYSVCQLAFGALAAALTPPMEVGGSATAGGLLLAASLAGMVALHVAEAALPPPRRYPDLHAVAFSAYACCHLVGAYAACLHALWRTTATAPPHTPLDGGGTTVRERRKAE